VSNELVTALENMLISGNILYGVCKYFIWCVSEEFMAYIKQISVKDNDDTTWNTGIYVCLLLKRIFKKQVVGCE
jgi:hypothetical protein